MKYVVAVVRQLIYYLVDHDGERIISPAPICVGDYVSVRLSDDTVLREKKVLRVTHLNEAQNVGKQTDSIHHT